MCGIVGLIDTTDKAVPRRMLGAMRDVMIARGPDGIGEYIEGHIGMAMRRLSVIDLKHGWQPLTSRNGNVIAFQNGEVYNFKELRQELQAEGYVFQTCSDTEVLAHGYACWGIDDLLSRIDGMYALAILDKDKRELYLARDRFGEKPLFYCFCGGRFAYASDLKVLAALPWVNGEVDPVSVNRYLALHYVPGQRTILQGVKRVLPGEYLRVSVDDPIPRRVRYYQMPIGSVHQVSDDEVAEAVEGAVKSRLIADVPVGVFLSGGLDSSLIAAIAARENPCIDTFSMGFHASDQDESPYARQIAQYVNSTPHHFVFDEDQFARLLPQVASSLDEPLGDQALLPLFWLAREARKHVKVVLSGEGADEVFGGYSYYSSFAPQPTVRDRIRTWLGGGNIGRGHFNLRRLSHSDLLVTPSGFPLLSDPEERERLLGGVFDEADEWEHELFRWLDAANDPLQRATCTDLATWLPDDLLVKYDRMAMANSLEGRAPYLDPKVVVVGMQGLPPEERMAGGVSKVALRRIARRWVPDTVLVRPKQGFVLPMRTWIKQWFEQHEGVSPYFTSRRLPLIDGLQVEHLVTSDLQQGIRRERMLFALIMLSEWYAAFRQTVDVLRDQYERSYKVAEGC